MPLAFSEGQLEQIKTFAYQLPRHLCSQYLHHLAQLLPRDFGDADVWRAAHKAVHEVMNSHPRRGTCAVSCELKRIALEPFMEAVAEARPPGEMAGEPGRGLPSPPT